VDALLQRIARHGPVPWSAYVNAALDEFFEGGGAGRREGDFVTSPEVGPLFGAVVARAVDSWWREAGEPDPWVVVDAGAGTGSLARSVLLAEPACARALRWVLVERSTSQRARHGDHLALETPTHAFAPDHHEDADPRAVDLPVGPIVISLGELPRLAGPCVVLANELLDNLPFDLWERRGDAWWEVRVGLDDNGAPVEAVVPSEPPAWLAAVDADEGARVPVQTTAQHWLREALAVADHVVVVDYSSTTRDLARRPQDEWLRTYRAHQRGGPPLEAPGTQDITVEVCVDQLAHVREPSTVASQADWLRTHGIDELVDEGRRVWRERAHVGDLAALRMRSRVTEAEALLDPSGLGAFRVLEWR
jgi:SAM-dependent MidA family methyltransferase